MCTLPFDGSILVTFTLCTKCQYNMFEMRISNLDECKTKLHCTNKFLSKELISYTRFDNAHLLDCQNTFEIVYNHTAHTSTHKRHVHDKKSMHRKYTCSIAHFFLQLSYYVLDFSSFHTRWLIHSLSFLSSHTLIVFRIHLTLAHSLLQMHSFTSLTLTVLRVSRTFNS